MFELQFLVENADGIGQSFRIVWGLQVVRCTCTHIHMNMFITIIVIMRNYTYSKSSHLSLFNDTRVILI